MLTQTGILENLDQAELDALFNFGELKPVQADEEVIKAGDEQNSLYILISGKLSVLVDASGRPIKLSEIEPGQCFGEINVFDPQVASASVTAQEFCQVWTTDRSRLEEYMTENPQAAAKLMIGIAHQLSKRLRSANQSLSSAKNVLPQLSQRLKDIGETVAQAQQDMPGLLAML